MPDETPKDITIIVTTNLVTVPDCRRAIDLFSRILRAAREQAAEEQREQCGRKPAA